jgi:hypothetical protein
MDFGTLIEKFGLPVAIAAFFIWQYVAQAKEHKQDLKDIAVKAVQAIDAGTEAIKDSTETAKLSNTTIERNVTVLNRVEGVLLSRGTQNGNGNGS